MSDRLTLIIVLTMSALSAIVVAVSSIISMMAVNAWLETLS